MHKQLQTVSHYDVTVIGGGPAGLAAALSARENGAKALLLERNSSLGGILNQCIHNGFGLHHFREELTGPEYAGRFIKQLEAADIDVLTGAMVLDVVPDKTLCSQIVRFIHPRAGYAAVTSRAVVLAMGCRERTRGAIGIPGARPAGVFTAGAAQLYMNMEGRTIGSRVVILGSGDIGLIMARRLTLEGAQVPGVFEVLPYSGGLTRNIVQCLEDYNIPLHLSHTITEIRGSKRVEQVVVSRVDKNRSPIPGTEMVIDCDTVLLSVGLIPENELSRRAGIAIDPASGGPVVYENMETSVPGIFACGNVAHVHDLVDFVSAEAVKAGRAAAFYAQDNSAGFTRRVIRIHRGEGVAYVVPQMIRLSAFETEASVNEPSASKPCVEIFFRTTAIYRKSTIEIRSGGKILVSFKREHLAPGEMEKIVLSKEVLEKAQGGAIPPGLEGEGSALSGELNGDPVIEISINSTTRQTEGRVHFRTVDKEGCIELVCIVCPRGCRLKVDPVQNYAVTGHGCKRGESYGRQEITRPARIITSTVQIRGAPLSRLPVKTNKPLPKEKVFDAMKLLDNLEVHSPVTAGTVIVKNVCGTGVDFVASRTL